MLLATGNLACVIPSQAVKLAQSSDVIQPLPQLLLKLCEYLKQEDPSLVELANDLAIDPKVTAGLLKVANSSVMALRHKVTKVPDVIKLLGVRRTVSLVLATSVVKTQSALVANLPRAQRTWYHYRSVLTASGASAFAERFEEIPADTAYILGLLQDSGIPVLANAFGQRYLQFLQRVQASGWAGMEFVEKEAFGITHADVSAALLQKWQLPQSLIALVLHHKEGDDPRNTSPAERSFLKVMRHGEDLANLAGSSISPDDAVFRRFRERYASEKAEDCTACLALAVAKTREASQLFAIPIPDEAALLELTQKIAEVKAEIHSDSGNSIGTAASPSTANSILTAPAPDPAPNVPSAQPATDKGVELEGALDQECVLVIDDELTVIRIVKKALSRFEFPTVSCDNPREAKVLARQATLIFCDVHLGKENGIAIIRELRQDGFSGPVVMMTGDGSRETVADCVAAGATDYLLKPFAIDVLVEKVQKHLRACPV